MLLMQEIKQLKQDGITLLQIQNELDYRENSNLNWDDDLYEYTIEELRELEQVLS